MIDYEEILQRLLSVLVSVKIVTEEVYLLSKIVSNLTKWSIIKSLIQFHLNPISFKLIRVWIKLD